MKRHVWIYLLVVQVFLVKSIAAQTLGGLSVFNFLRTSNSPRLTALGGINLSHPANEVGMAFQNPSLLRPSMDQQLHLAFHDLYGEVAAYHLSYGYYREKWKTSFGGGLQFFDYGKAMATDASGNLLGAFHPADLVLQVSAARTYAQKWHYGATLKYISSRYGLFRANGLAMDVGLHYADSSDGFQVAVVLKNAGLQTRKYNGGSTEELPFELQAGITKRLKGSPFSLSLTAQQMHRFDIRYYDIDFNQANGNTLKKPGGMGKLLDHLVIGTTIHITDRLEADLGYNFLRRRELNIGTTGNGLNGFSYGMELKLKKFMFHFARAHYQANTASNQLGLTLNMAEFW